MLVDYKTILNGDAFEDNPIISQFTHPTDVHKYVVLRTDFCCDEMEKNWGEAIGFGEWEDNPVCNNTSVSMYYQESYGIKAIPINVCPFCGKLITTMEIEKTKLEKYTKPMKINQVCHREVKVE